MMLFLPLIFALAIPARAQRVIVPVPELASPLGSAAGGAAAGVSAGGGAGALLGPGTVSLNPALSPVKTLSPQPIPSGPSRVKGVTPVPKVGSEKFQGALMAIGRGADAQREEKGAVRASGYGTSSFDGGLNRKPGMTPEDIPAGTLNDKVKEAFFREALVERRKAAARRLVELRGAVSRAAGEPYPAGIVFLGDRHDGALDAYENAKEIRRAFAAKGESVLVISGHGGPGPGGMGAFIAEPAGGGPGVYFFADTDWGALELRDVILRAGYSLDGYDKIIFATCHGGASCSFAKASPVEVWGTNPEGKLHYASGIVQNAEHGYNLGLFPDAGSPDATKIYPAGL